VLSERNHCYCVLLNAHGGPAFPTDEDLPECNSSRPVNVHKDVEEAKPSKVLLFNSLILLQYPILHFVCSVWWLHVIIIVALTLFSGFVSYQMVREAYDDLGAFCQWAMVIQKLTRFTCGALVDVGRLKWQFLE
ncbi:hypothetical protein B296_00046085, partial [Ensete ventricosum]